MVQLQPRYDSEPILQLDGDPSAICEPAVRQSRRLSASLAELTDEQWAHPSRCEGWAVRDVIVHLSITNQFWAASVSAGCNGEPTKFLASFDPATSPREMGATNVDPPEKVLADYLGATEAWCSLLEGLSAEQWQMKAEAPPGHTAISAVVHHALWDSWIHERDVFLPLGQLPTQEPDEISMALRYALGLSAGLELSQGNKREGLIQFEVANPADEFTVRVADSVMVASGRSSAAPVVAADALPLMEGVSMRAPMPVAVDDSVAWMFDGLKQAFDQ